MNAKADAVEAEVVETGSQDSQQLQPAEQSGSVPAITPMDMLQKAVEADADLDKLKQLMDLQERWEASQAKKAFTAAMQRFKADPPTIIKNITVEHSGASYKHADLAQVCRAVGEGLAEVGISHRWEMKQEGNVITVWCILTHTDGHSESVSLSAPPDDSGSKNVVQRIASTVTYLERYTLMAVAGVAAQEDDDGGGPVELIDEQQFSTLTDMIADSEADREKFLEYLGVEKLKDLAADRYPVAVAALKAKKKDNEKKAAAGGEQCES